MQYDLNFRVKIFRKYVNSGKKSKKLFSIPIIFYFFDDLNAILFFPEISIEKLRNFWFKFIAIIAAGGYHYSCLLSLLQLISFIIFLTVTFIIIFKIKTITVFIIIIIIIIIIITIHL